MLQTFKFSYIIFFVDSAKSLTTSSTKDLLKGFQDILPADESFKFSAFKIEERIILSWELKENCFLYKDKFEITALPKTYIDIVTTETSLPINDEYFGEVEVFYNNVTKSFVHDENMEKIMVKYQGCNAKGFCYPVINKELIIKKGKNIIIKGT